MHLSDATLRRHRAQVFDYLRKRTGSPELAEDLTQEVFETAAAHLHRLDSEETILAWLYRVARNRLIDEARRRGRRPQLVALDIDSVDGPIEYDAQLGAAIRRASLRLSAADGELLGLRLLVGCPFAEVARRLGITEGAAKMRYLRALHGLRDELAKEGVTDAD